MSKQFLAVLAAIVIIFAGFIIFGGNKSQTSSKSTSKATPTQHVEEGQGKAGVTLVEYGDYQCPYCEQYYPLVKQAQAQFNDQIKFQFRNFPLTSLHPNAFAAARAAEAANLQNKFWEMHDMLYDNTNWSVWTKASNPNPYFDQYAKQLGLDTAKFKKDFASSRVNDVINADIDVGNQLKITGTPSFFINGKKVEISATPEAFQKVIQNAIDQAKTDKSNQ